MTRENERHVIITPEIHNRLVAFCEENGLKIGYVACRAIVEWLDGKQERKN